MTSVGKQYRYVASHARAMGRYGQLVTVLEWHYSKALVRFPDGWTVLTPGRCLRKPKPSKQPCMIIRPCPRGE